MSTSDKKTKLQELATLENRKAIFRLLTEGKTVEKIGVIFDFTGEGGKEKTLSILEAGLLPEQFENIPSFNLETRELSNEEFKKHRSLFGLAIDFKKEGFLLNEASAMAENGIFHYGELIQSENIIDKERLDSFFTQLLNCKIKTPVVFTPEQQAQLKEE